MINHNVDTIKRFFTTLCRVYVTENNITCGGQKNDGSQSKGENGIICTIVYKLKEGQSLKL